MKYMSELKSGGYLQYEGLFRALYCMMPWRDFQKSNYNVEKYLFQERKACGNNTVHGARTIISRVYESSMLSVLSASSDTYYNHHMNAER